MKKPHNLKIGQRWVQVNNPETFAKWFDVISGPTIDGSFRCKWDDNNEFIWTKLSTFNFDYCLDESSVVTKILAKYGE